MSATGQPGQPGQPSEEELRAAYEAEIKKIRIEQIVLEQVVSLVNLGMRRTGLAPGTEDERDIGQVQLAIESVRALLPVLERAAPGQVGQIRDALSQLQMAFVRLGGAPGQAGETDAPQPSAAGPGPGATAPGAAPQGAPGTPADPHGRAQPEGDPAESGEGGPAQRSGRLWVPGQ